MSDTPDNQRSGYRDRGEGRGRGRAGGRGRGRGGGSRGRGNHDEKGDRPRNKETGRAEWSRNTVDKRARNDEQNAKRRRLDGKEGDLPVYAVKFSKEEIEAQEKKPKRKVAVMIGYSGTGYKGLQLNHHEKTIEGDLFSAFVNAGAISKANADDPKKSSLVRCARTDKGVHAAGNLLSLKLIVEDSDIVAKINEQLNPQIRVWGIERTNGSFSAYQHCDSRIYEYLIPTSCFLPPHPKSFLGTKMVELAEEAQDSKGYISRQEEVRDFWSEAEEKYVKPVIDEIDPSIREDVLQIFYNHATNTDSVAPSAVSDAQKQAVKDEPVEDESISIKGKVSQVHEPANDHPEAQTESKDVPIEDSKELTPIEVALRRLKAAHIIAKKAYRIHPARLARVRSSLSRFEGSHKYHNYTVDKSFRDPSATRIIKSFVVGEKPIVIGDTEWLSLKVHGQSFMMHQIRKMVSMVALIVHCGCHEGRLQDSYLADRISIPKAPSLGLLLERPVFDAYNGKLAEYGREKIDFSRYDREIEEFKQKEIYEKIFQADERDAIFHSFFTALDNTRSPQLFYLSSLGIEGTKLELPRGNPGEASIKSEKTDVDQVSSDDDGGDRDGQEG